MSAIGEPVSSSAMLLRPGVATQCVDGTGEWRTRISIGSGLQRPAAAGYVADACIPRCDWRDPLDCELAILDRAGADVRHQSDAVSLWRLPERLRSGFDFMSRSLERRNHEHIAENLLTTSDYRRARDMVLDYLGDAGFSDTARLLGHCVNPPGQLTVGLRDGLFVGVHVDNYIPQGIEERSGFPSRLCINLGPEDRFLVYTNLTFDSVRRLALVSRTESSVEFQNEYYRWFADYPLVRLRIKPGEAYIAPTQTIMHEGSTLGKSSVDMLVTYIGDFGIDNVERLREPDVGQAV